MEYELSVSVRERNPLNPWDVIQSRAKKKYINSLRLFDEKRIKKNQTSTKRKWVEKKKIESKKYLIWHLRRFESLISQKWWEMNFCSLKILLYQWNYILFLSQFKLDFSLCVCVLFRFFSIFQLFNSLTD